VTAVQLADGRGAARFRAELDAWLDDNQPSSVRTVDRPLSTGHLPDWARDWQRMLFDAGWLVPRWPEGLGGRAAGPLEHLIYLEELSRRHVPRSLNPQGLDVCAPVLVERGTDDQRERWALSTLRGEITWCLAVGREGLRPAESTVPGFRLTETDGVLLVAGRERAPAGAQHADLCLCVVRSDRPPDGSDGVTVVAVDLRSPGVVRPLRPDLTDVTHDADELIFDDVELTRSDVVGDVHRGIPVVQAAHAHERSVRWTTSLVMAQRALDSLVAMGHAHGLAQDPVFRDSVAALRVDADGVRALAYRAMAKNEAGRPAPELAMLPLLTHELEQRVFLAGTEALGGDGVDLGLDGPLPWPSGAWGTHWLAALSDVATVNGLTERDRVAARVLGMPPT
jgi:alkylation response protein AidB-like acyl-CoA dehydrogenase